MPQETESLCKSHDILYGVCYMLFSFSSSSFRFSKYYECVCAIDKCFIGVFGDTQGELTQEDCVMLVNKSKA